jgi:hypothetical protein
MEPPACAARGAVDLSLLLLTHRFEGRDTASLDYVEAKAHADVVLYDLPLSPSKGSYSGRFKSTGILRLNVYAFNQKPKATHQLE